MTVSNRLRRKQLLREAEGYLDLVLALADQWPVQQETRQRMAQRALDALNQLDDTGSRRAHDWHLRGQALQLMEQYGQAIHCYDKATKLDGENIHTWLALGWCHKRNGRLDLAIQSLEEALAVDSSEAIVHYNLACYWSLANNVKLAIAYLTRAFDIDPQFRDLVSAEPDFDPIRDEPSFQAVLTVIV